SAIYVLADLDRPANQITHQAVPVRGSYSGRSLIVGFGLHACLPTTSKSAPLISIDLASTRSTSSRCTSSRHRAGPRTQREPIRVETSSVWKVPMLPILELYPQKPKVLPE